MKNLVLEEFEAQTRRIIMDDVLERGDVVRVDCGNAGAFVAMKESEYKILRDALVTVYALESQTDDNNDQIDMF
jgi:hypothetical protein